MGWRRSLAVEQTLGESFYKRSSSARRVWKSEGDEGIDREGETCDDAAAAAPPPPPPIGFGEDEGNLILALKASSPRFECRGRTFLLCE